MTTVFKRCLKLPIQVVTNSFPFKNSSRYFTVNMTAVVDTEQIRNKLINELRASHVEVRDDSGGCGANITCIVVADKFEGVPLLQRHRLVNKILNEEIKNIHAFSSKTYTPDQWEDLKEKEGK